MGAARRLARVRKEALVACITCPLCRGLLREATAIAECLHAFCRECIMEKINDEDVDCCPVCDIDLGCDPEEKLRPDHNLQDIRNKVFPIRRKVDSPKTPTVTLLAKRKQRSISSLVVDTPSAAIHTGLTGKRTKATRTTASRATSPSNIGITKLPTKSENRDQKAEKSSATQSTKAITSTNKKQRNTDVKASSKLFSEDMKNGKVTDKQEVRKSRSRAKNHALKEEKIKNQEDDIPINKEDTENKVVISGTKARARSNKRIKEEKNGGSSEPASSKDKTTTEDNLNKGLLGSASIGALHDAITTPAWFSLVASPNQKDPQLPQLPKNYLRIKDGSLQISSVQRYIMNKLDLASEDEVEITCHGEAVSPSTMLRNLVQAWLKKEPAEPVQAWLGAPAEQFVMALGYRRRRRAPAA